jgi:excisionase family DNA binding protein
MARNRAERRHPAPERLVLTVAEVMDSTGLSRQYVYNEIKSGRLRSLKVGRRRLVRIPDLDPWLDSFADTAAAE